MLFRSQLREGITYTGNTDGVIIWEVYRKTDALVLAFCGCGWKRMDEYLRAVGEDGRSLLERMEEEIGPLEPKEDTEGHRLTAGCDFSAGGDESVLVVRQGNVDQVLLLHIIH